MQDNHQPPMSEIFTKPPQLLPLDPPDVRIILHGCGRVNFAWKYTRNVPFWFLYHNREPGAMLEFSDGVLRPGADDVVLIPPYTPFCSCCEKPFEHFYIHFTVGRPYTQIKPGRILLKSSDCPILGKMLHHQEEPSAIAIYAFLYTALACIPPERLRPSAKQGDDRIQRAIGMVGQHMDNTAICRAIGMSNSNFQRLFKQEIGMSPQRYSMQMRLERARCWLTDGDDDIATIAVGCGFADRYAFSKAFKKYIGYSPAQYRSAPPTVP